MTELIGNCVCIIRIEINIYCVLLMFGSFYIYFNTIAIHYVYTVPKDRQLLSFQTSCTTVQFVRFICVRNKNNTGSVWCNLRVLYLYKVKMIKGSVAV